MKLVFKLDRETKNMIRFDYKDGMIIGTIYVHKDAFDGKFPESIKVELTGVSEDVVV